MLIRIVCNGVKVGGGERSAMTIAAMMADRGHRVVWHPTTEGPMAFDPGCKVGPWYRPAKLACDLLLFCANNTVQPQDPRGHHRPPTGEDFRHDGVRVMLLNWRIGMAAEIADRFHHVATLSTRLADEWYRLTKRTAWTHAPAVDPEAFLTVRPDYGAYVLARYSASGKWPSDTAEMTDSIRRSAPVWRFRSMGLPASRHAIHEEVMEEGAVPPPEFLEGASAFWYPLGANKTEQGPRVIVEAMYAGLPCLVDDREGPADRVVGGTGWRVADHRQYARVLRKAREPELRERGEAARDHAVRNFNPADWADWLESLV